MRGLLLLGLRRSLRNAPLTLAVLAGLLVLVTLLLAAPIYMSALADMGLRATLAQAPLDQRGIRAIFSATRLNQVEYARLSQSIYQEAQAAVWLKPTLLSAMSTRTLLLPGGYAQGRVSLVDAETALANLRTLEGRLPRVTGADGPMEVVLGTTAADTLGLRLGDRVTLTERVGSEPVVTIQVVGLVEPADATAPFWQSHMVDLDPIVSPSRREGSLLVAPGMVWAQVVPYLPEGRASGEYRWRIVFDLVSVDQSNVMQAEADISAMAQRIRQVLDSANASSGFGQVVADYHHRLAIMRAPLLLLFIEIAGLALIYIAWTAAFQAEATASEQAMLGARGAAVRQILAISGGQAAVLVVGAALAGIPLALLLLRVTTHLGPMALLARVHELRLHTTPDARAYASAAAAAGFLVLAVPAIPAARRSITALRQETARPATSPLWQRSYLDLLVIVIAGVALVQLERQGSLLQRLQGRFEIDPLLVAAPFLLLVAGALLFLRVYPWLLHLTHGLMERQRGFPLTLALVQLTRNRAASTRLVLLLSLTSALGLFTQTFGANLVINQRRQAGYLVGADGRATLTDNRPLLPRALPPGVHSSWAFRDTVAMARGNFTPVPLLAIEPARFATVAYNPASYPVLPLSEVLEALGPTPPLGGLALLGQPRQLSLTLELREAPFSPAVILSDVAGRFHRLRLSSTSTTRTRQTFVASLDLPAAAFPVHLVALGLLATNRLDWGPDLASKAAFTVTFGSLAVDGAVMERWNGAIPWEATPDATVDPRDPAAGVVSLRGSDLTIYQGRQMRGVLLRPNPQDLAPVPVAVDEQVLRANNLTLGSTTLFLVRSRLVPVHIVAVPARFPSLGIDAEPFVVAHGPRLLRFLNSSFATLTVPNELWLDLPDDAATIEQVRRTRGVDTLLLQTTVLRSLSRDPLAVGIAGIFFLGFVTSVGLTALGFGISIFLSGRRRTVEFAVLQAIGLDRRGVLRTLAVEQAALVSLALFAGTGLGAGLGRLILPLMAISDEGRAVVPPYLVIVPWRTLALTYGALIALFASVTMLVLWLLLRRGIGSALRIGEA